MQQETDIIGNRRHMLSSERYWQNMIDREMVEEENKDEKIRHENSSGCMHGNHVYQSVSTDGTGGKEKGKLQDTLRVCVKSNRWCKEIEIFFGGCTGFWSAYSLSSQPGENDSVCM